MSFQPKMVDNATGASPPWSSTREAATSPVNFNSSIPMATSDEIIITNKVMNKQLTSPFPSPITNESSTTSPMLSSTALMKPVPLMSLNTEGGGGGVNTSSNSSSTINKTNKQNANNRYWPVDHLNRYDNRNHQKRTRNNRRYKNHRHQPYPYCTQCTARPQMQSSVNCYHENMHHDNDHRTCCTYYGCCP